MIINFNTYFTRIRVIVLETRWWGRCNISPYDIFNSSEQMITRTIIFKSYDVRILASVLHFAARLIFIISWSQVSGERLVNSNVIRCCMRFWSSLSHRLSVCRRWLATICAQTSKVDYLGPYVARRKPVGHQSAPSGFLGN